jgi:hypothetical protein
VKLLLTLAGCITIAAFARSETVSVLALIAIAELAMQENWDGEILKVIYRGNPIRLDRSKIKAGMRVPTRRGVERLGDPNGGMVAATLFHDALASGAIIAPKELRLECYADDDETGGGIILVAFPDTKGPSTGLTSGWRAVENISADDHQDPFDPALVIDALTFFVAELNTACRLGRAF